MRKQNIHSFLKVYPRSVKLQNDQTRAYCVCSKAHLKCTINSHTSLRCKLAPETHHIDTEINSAWKLEILPLEPDIEIQDQPLEEIDRPSSDSDKNVESSDRDENVENTT